MDDGTSVKADLKSELDFIEVAAAIQDICETQPMMLKVLEFIFMMSATDPKFKELKKKNTIKIPDFNEILKNNK